MHTVGVATRTPSFFFKFLDPALHIHTCAWVVGRHEFQQYSITPDLKGTVSRYIDKNRTGACGLGRNRRLLRHTELVFLSTVYARRVVLVLFTNMDAVN